MQRGLRGWFASRRLMQECQPNGTAFAELVAQHFDYSNGGQFAQRENDDVARARFFSNWAPPTEREEPAMAGESSTTRAAFGRSNLLAFSQRGPGFYLLPAEAPYCPSQDANCVSCCDFRSTQLLMP